MAGSATCEANGIVIRSEPVALELRVPDVEVMVAEPPKEAAPAKRPLKERRMIAYGVLGEDVRLAAGEGGPLFDEMLWRIHRFLAAMEREVDGGRY